MRRLGLSGVLAAVVSCAAQSTDGPASTGHVVDRSGGQRSPQTPASELGTGGSIVLPPPQERGPMLTVIGSVQWTTSTPGCVVITLSGGQRFQLTGTTAADGERRARAGEMPAIQQVEVAGHIPPVGATSCGPMRAFWAERVTAR